MTQVLALHSNYVPPVGGSWNCDDASIWLPRLPDTVTTSALILVVLAIAIATVSYI